jgi:hypothetical protein
MKKIFIWALLYSTEIIAQDTTEHFNKKIFVENIISTYIKIKDFERKYDELDLHEYEDSIMIYNLHLSEFFLNKKIIKLSIDEAKTIKENTEIEIVFSGDKKLQLVSWGVFSFFPIPLCTSLLIYGGRAEIISLNGTLLNDFGYNIQYEKIHDFKFNNRSYYLLTGSNKCVNLCIEKIMSMYFIHDGKMTKCVNSFIDGKKSMNDLMFDYLINQYTKSQPAFQIQGKSIICPIFNSAKTKVIGNKKIRIQPRNQ